MRLLSLFLLLVISPVQARSTLPHGCQPMVVQGEAVTLQAKKNRIFLIHNITPNELWITHPVAEPSASAGWNSRLQTKKWSALFLDKGSFLLNCIESQPGHEQQVPCEQAIAVCEWQRATIPADAKGTFWVAENKSLHGLMNAIGARGFKLKK